MSVVYKLGYLIPFLIITFFYIEEFGNIGVLYGLFNFVFSVLGGKTAYMILHNNFDLSIVLKPCCMVSAGVIAFTYIFSTAVYIIYLKSPIKIWNKITLIAPLGIILIRLGNIINGEAEGIINYATADIVGAVLMGLAFLFSKKIKENSTLFALFFYSFWRLFIVEPIRGVSFSSPAYLYFIPLFISALGTYYFFYRLEKRKVLN